ncbi:MAG TPA: ABC transporter substrate-binding protein [Mycobacteriales bacterium]|nr:ABC transporter substrate-binding protein [Mycobacteriales bacterium]
MTTPRSRYRLGVCLVAVALASTACASSSGGSTPTGGNPPGKTADVATWALPPNTVPNWIWPFTPIANFSVTNASTFQWLMYRPLYWFGDSSGGPSINPDLSLANLPVYSDGGRTVTITLKPYAWSNGEKVSSADVLFWINMERAEKANYAGYVPGQFPDNVTSATAPDGSTVVLKLNAAYSQQWFTYNQLGQITPMPTAWDVTSTSTTGACAALVSGCAAVYQYMLAQTKDLPTYATNPLWQVVDGPWKLASFNADGHLSFVPNPAYSGAQKPTLKKLVMAPFTTDSAEFNVLRSGQTLDVGYLPTQDVTKAKAAGSGPATAGPNPLGSNYSLAPLFLYGINYFPLNFNNPTVGPIFKQLYFRQALQSVVDQNSIITAAAKGYGVPTTGPIPTYPDSPLVSTLEKQNPYPFSLDAARAYLTGHGWNVVPGGTTTCTRPGTGPTDCGAGIAAGQKLSFDLQYASGQQTIDTAMQSLKSNAAQVGIRLTLDAAPFNTVTATAVPCSGPKCTWQLGNWGGGWAYSPDYYPTGESIFSSGAGSNSGSFSDPSIDGLIHATNVQSGTAAMLAYEDALAKALPVIWQPNYTYSLTEVANGLHGVTPQNPFGGITPESWHF